MPLATPTLSLRQMLSTMGWFLKHYSWRSSVIIALLFLAGLAESIGVLAILPLVVLASGETGGQGEFERAIIDAMHSAGLPVEIWVILTGLVLAMITKAGLTILAMSQVGYGGARMTADLRTGFVRALLNARWSYFTEQPTGSLANTINQEAQRGATVYIVTCNIVINLIQVVIYAILAMLVSIQASIVAVLLGLAMLLMLRGIVRKARSAAIQERQGLRNLMIRLIDGLTVIKPLKAMALENSLSPVLEHETASLNRAQRRQVLFNAIAAAVQEPFLTMSLAVGVYVALTFGDMTFAQIIFLAVIAQRVFTRMGGLQGQIQKMAVHEPALTFIRQETAKAEAAREIIGGHLKPEFTREIRFDGVSFAYDKHTTIEEVSLSIPKGVFVAIIGPSGAGKTTMIDLVTGLLRPQVGQIVIDDKPLEDTNIRLWRESIGYVAQEAFLFHDTIAANITLGDNNYSPEDVEAALEAAGAMEFVSLRTSGINEVVGEHGGKLSGGQRQRISIARALIRKPNLLILDEPTLGLDPTTEASVLRTLQDLAGTITILVISHQPNVISAAGLVHRLANGRLVETIEKRDQSVSSDHAPTQKQEIQCPAP